MPVCKLITQHDPRFQIPNSSKFIDGDSYLDLYCYLRGIHPANNAENSSYPKKEKTPNDFHGSRCLDYYRAPQEMEALARGCGKYEGIKLRHYVISLGPEECKWINSHLSCCLILEEIAERFLDCFYGQYQCYYVIHEDTAHPHIHVCCSTVNIYTGMKYPGDKKSYFSLQNEMNRFTKERFNMRFFMVPDIRD